MGRIRDDREREAGQAKLDVEWRLEGEGRKGGDVFRQVVESIQPEEKDKNNTLLPLKTEKEKHSSHPER